MKFTIPAIKKIWLILWLIIILVGFFVLKERRLISFSEIKQTFLSSGSLIAESFNTITAGFSNSSDSEETKGFEVPADFVLVKAGAFTINNNAFMLDEFYMKDSEVTVFDYCSVTGEVSPSIDITDSRSKSYPVNNVSWYDCINYCNKKSAIDGLEPVYTVDGKNVTADFSKNGWRLPTKAEWYWAASGAKHPHEFEYSGSNDINEVAWYIKNSGETVHECKTKKPNQLGIYDLTGNVAEWCWDRYWDWTAVNFDKPYENNYQGPDDSSNIQKRAICGGFYGNSAKTSRFYNYQDLCGPTGKTDSYGFRIVKNTK